MDLPNLPQTETENLSDFFSLIRDSQAWGEFAESIRAVGDLLDKSLAAALATAGVTTVAELEDQPESDEEEDKSGDSLD